MQHRTWFIFAVALLLLIGGLVSCEMPTEENGEETGETGTLSVLLADAPFPIDLVAEASVTIDSVDIREQDAEDAENPFHTLTTEQSTYNLLDLQNGVTASLAELEIPVGSYDLIRLYVSAAQVILTDGTEYDLMVPSGAQTGLKVFIDPAITVEGGLTAELLLDMDVSKSFIPEGAIDTPAGITGFLFKPVVRAANLSTAGRIAGSVTDSTGSAAADVQVWAETDSVVSATFTEDDGSYALIGLPEDTYTVKALIHEDTMATANVEVVAANETTVDIQWSDGTGKLTVEMTDAPFPVDTVASAMVTIDSIDARQAGETADGAYITLTTESRSYDLLELRNGVTVTLADLEIPEGEYDQIRLYISEAGIELKDGQTYDLTVPSGAQTGLKLFIEPAMQVKFGVTSELLLDFDVSKSFVAQGSFEGPQDFEGFIFRPTLRAVNKSTAGDIVGTITDTTGTTGAAMPDVQVWVQVDQDTVTATFTDEDGGYALLGLPADTYLLQVSSVEYDTTITVSESVEVVAGSATRVDYQFDLE